MPGETAVYSVLLSDPAILREIVDLPFDEGTLAVSPVVRGNMRFHRPHGGSSNCTMPLSKVARSVLKIASRRSRANRPIFEYYLRNLNHKDLLSRVLEGLKNRNSLLSF